MPLFAWVLQGPIDTDHCFLQSTFCPGSVGSAIMVQSQTTNSKFVQYMLSRGFLYGGWPYRRAPHSSSCLVLTDTWCRASSTQALVRTDPLNNQCICNKSSIELRTINKLEGFAVQKQRIQQKRMKSHHWWCFILCAWTIQSTHLCYLPASWYRLQDPKQWTQNSDKIKPKIVPTRLQEPSAS